MTDEQQHGVIRRYDVSCTTASIAADDAYMGALYTLARKTGVRVGDLVRSAVDAALSDQLTPLLPADYVGSSGS